MLLYGTTLAQEIKSKLQSEITRLFTREKHYIAILFFGDNSSSRVYVKHKQKYAKEIWLQTFVFWQQHQQLHARGVDFKHLLHKEYQSPEEVLELINRLNNDEDCIGIMIQLPLPKQLNPYRNLFLQAIVEHKDIDGLGGSLVGKSFSEYVEFTPATARAVMMLLDYYTLGDLRNKRVAIIGQSVVVGKPLALECLKRGAVVQCCDIRNTSKEIKHACQSAEYVFSGTGAIHLINASHTNEKKNQIFIDIGYGHLNGKAVGDIDFWTVYDRVAHITPVPGGIGPLTIAALFSNVISLRKQYHL